jgi:putative ABC transport system permease protein
MSVDRWLTIVRLRLRSLFRRAAMERELDDEFADHIARQTAENLRAGMGPEAARLAALRAFGGIEGRKEDVRDTRGTRWLEDGWRDLTLAVRSLKHKPGFAAAVVLTLALGTGANTAMFTVLHGALLRPLPNRDAGRLVYLRQTALGLGSGNVLFSVPEVNDYRTARALGAIAEYSNSVPFTMVAREGYPVRIRAGVVSGNYFDVLGLAPVLGRLTNMRDDGAQADPVAVLSYDYWMQHFGGDSGVLGETVRLNDKVTTIVGVVQSAPDYPYATDVYMNTVTSPHHLSATMITMRSHRMTEMFARLAPGATVDRARQEVRRIAAAAVQDHPDIYERTAHYRVTVTPLKDAEDAGAVTTFWLLMGAAAFVLLIACANVANLTLMRGVERSRELTVRTALGAGLGRLRRMLVAENLLLALVGGALGTLVAVAGLRLLVRFAAQFSPRAGEIRMDGLVLAASVAVSAVVAVVLSFLPGIGGDRSLAASLLPAGRRNTLGRAGQRLQRSFVVAQVAVCLVLLAGAGLMARTLLKLQAVETGVRVDHVLTMSLPLTNMLADMRNTAANLSRYAGIRDRVAALPEVGRVALASNAPLRPGLMDFNLLVENHPTDPTAPPHARTRMVDPSYFAVAGIPVLEGRVFDATDRAGTPRVVVLSRLAATELFDTEDPVGRRIALTGEMLKMSPFSGEWRTVIGVVGDTRDRGIDRDPLPAMYMPFAQEVIIGATLVIRTSSDPVAVRASALRAVRETAPTQMIEHVATLEQIRDESVAPRRLNTLFIAAFGLLALAIATVGIAGVLGFAVSSRTAEIGIRMSIGADTWRVHRMVLWEGAMLLAAGVAVGLVGAVFTTRVLRSLLFGVTAHDPVTLGLAALVLGATGLAACWLPAARAARVDPAVALRTE